MKTAILILLVLQTLWISYIAAVAPEKSSVAIWIFAWLIFVLPTVAAFAYIIAT